jgi:hypothetical protein
MAIGLARKRSGPAKETGPQRLCKVSDGDAQG